MSDLATLVAERRALVAERRAVRGARLVVGIAGPPGVGKSTATAALTAALVERGIPSASLPMDGYHLPQAELVRLGRRDRMGAADTFDVAGYLAALRAVAADDGEVVAAGFDRAIEEPVPGAVRIPADARVVVTEGNWLLLADDGWGEVRPELDLAVFLTVADAIRIPRLIARHVRSGKTPAQAEAWVARSDEANTARIAPTIAAADAILRLE